jgi:hypothetical protein
VKNQIIFISTIILVRESPNIASDKVYQLLAHGLWFSRGTLASSSTKTGCHDIDEILLKVELNTKNQIKSNHQISVI